MRSLPATADLGAIRRYAALIGGEAGLVANHLGGLIIAVSEIATNGIVHGGGEVMLRAWREDQRLVIEVRDEGMGFADPLAGYCPPRPEEPCGRGLWMARQLCHLVQVRSGPEGTIVRLYAELPDGPSQGPESGR